MKKFWLLFKLSFSRKVAYRGEILLKIIESLTSPLVIILVISSANIVSGLSTENLIQYYLTIGLVLPVVRSSIDESLNEYTSSGEINMFLVKPISMFKYFLFVELSEKIISFIAISPILIIFFGIQKLVQIVPILFITYFLYYCFSYFIGLGSFWIDEFWPIQNLKIVTVGALGGTMIYLGFFPIWFQNVLNILPFKYMTPARLVFGDLGINNVVIGIVWILAFLFAISFFEKKTIKEYSHTGS